MSAYYNEYDPYAAQWLRNLIQAGLIADGDVDERDIRDVHPSDVRGYTQCHFFAGIGGWSLALRLARIPDDRPVWSGSCPCQPFSAAGQGRGFADERHLWPAFFHIIEQCRPALVMGEQVASRDGLAWLDLVQTDLEGAGYASRAIDTCAAGIGAPQIRQRLYWVANANRWQRDRIADGEGRERNRTQTGRKQSDGESAAGGELCRLADAKNDGQQRGGDPCEPAGRHGTAFRVDTGRLVQSDRDRCEPWQSPAAPTGHRNPAQSASGNDRPGPLNGFWRDADWLGCRDGKWRPVEPGTFPLVDGLPTAMDGLGPVSRVDAIKGFGNAIVPQVAAAFISAMIPP